MRRLIFISLILINLSTSYTIVQAANEEPAVVNYHLDEQTLAKGYPAAAVDERFQVMVWPNVLTAAADLTITGPTSIDLGQSYEYQILTNGQVPLITKKITLVYHADQSQASKKYQRLYIYHQSSAEWLALTTRLDKTRQLVVSDVDFGVGIIGVRFSDTSLPDRFSGDTDFLSDKPLISTDTGATATYTLELSNDIIETGYTVEWQGIRLGILPQTLANPSTLALNYNSDTKVLDYNFISHNSGQPAITPGKMLLLNWPVVGDRRDKVLTFWDNNAANWRALPSNYQVANQRLTAKSPFSFGRYRIADQPDAYVGQASWFRDSLISKTRLGVASNDYPLGTIVKVTNVDTGASVIVEVCSTGPFVAGRIIDLTYTAFSAVGNPKEGIINVRVVK